MLGAFQDAKRTGNGLAHTLCKGWSRYPRLLRGALRALHDGEAAAVAHLAPHLPRRSPLMIPEASVDDAASDDDATDPNKSTTFHHSADVPPKSVK